MCVAALRLVTDPLLTPASESGASIFSKESCEYRSFFLVSPFLFLLLRDN